MYVYLTYSKIRFERKEATAIWNFKKNILRVKLRHTRNTLCVAQVNSETSLRW